MGYGAVLGAQRAWRGRRVASGLDGRYDGRDRAELDDVVGGSFPASPTAADLEPAGAGEVGLGGFAGHAQRLVSRGWISGIGAPGSTSITCTR
jgi:hypothetical protein